MKIGTPLVGASRLLDSTGLGKSPGNRINNTTMLSYPNPPRPSNGVPRVCCARCGEPSRGYYYCFRCRLKHAAGARDYMRKRRENEAFRAAERIKTKLRMRRLRAALRKAKQAAALYNALYNRRSRTRRQHQAALP